MIQFLSERTARYLAKDNDTVDIEVLTYGCYLFYQEWIIRIVMLLVALPFGLFFHVLASIIAFTLIRRCAMGAHARYPIVCKIMMSFVVFTPAILAEFFHISFTPVAFVVMYIFGLVSLLLYAPAETDVKKVRDLQQRKRLKLESIAWLSALFLASVLLQGILPAISFAIVATAILACCFVHPWMYIVNGFDPITREERNTKKGD